MKLFRLLFVLQLFAYPLLAQEGSWDSSFANNGTLFIAKANNNFAIEDAASAVQKDGRIIFASRGSVQTLMNANITGAGIFRLMPDGTRDTSFGNVMPFGLYVGYSIIPNITGEVKKILIQKDGKIVIGTELEAFQTFALGRLKANGTVDSSFGGTGAVAGPGVWRTAFLTGGQSMNMQLLQDMAFNPDSTAIYAVGWGRVQQYNSAYDYRGLAAKYKLNGQLDSSWGTNGHLLLESSGLLNKTKTGIRTYTIAVQADGKILIGGEIWNNETDVYGGPEYFIVRYNANGTKDTQFGTNGVVVAHTFLSNGLGSTETAAAVLANIFVDHSGKINCVGGYYASLPGIKNKGYFITRWTTTGAIDSSFGTNGTFRLGVSSNQFTMRNAIPQVNGKIVATGTWIIDSLYQGQLIDEIKPFVMRIDTNNYPDVTFGNQGYFSYDAIAGAPPLPANNFHTASYASIQPDGKIIVTGRTNSFFIGRIKADSAIAQTTGSNSVPAVANELMIHVYPNPVYNSTVRIEAAWGNTDVQVNLYDLTGKMLLKKRYTANGGAFELRLPDQLRAGNYFLRVESIKDGSSGSFTLTVQ